MKLLFILLIFTINHVLCKEYDVVPVKKEICSLIVDIDSLIQATLDCQINDYTIISDFNTINTQYEVCNNKTDSIKLNLTENSYLLLNKKSTNISNVINTNIVNNSIFFFGDSDCINYLNWEIAIFKINNLNIVLFSAGGSEYCINNMFKEIFCNYFTDDIASVVETIPIQQPIIKLKKRHNKK